MHAVIHNTKMNLSTVKWAQWDKTQSRELLGLFMCVCIALYTIAAHNIAQNRPDNFPSYPPDNHHCSDDVYLSEGRCTPYHSPKLQTDGRRQHAFHLGYASHKCNESSRECWLVNITNTFIRLLSAFSALTPLVGWQEGHPACNI